MPNLYSLPAELVLEICSYLKPSPADLSRLSQTCAPLRDFAQPLLFSSFDPSPGHATCDTLVKLVRSLESRPDLAKCLTSFDDGTHDYCRNMRLSDSDNDYIEKLIASLHLPIPDGDRRCFFQTGYILTIELIMILAPNLVDLKVTIMFDWQSPLLETYVARLKNAFLPRLRSLRVSHDPHADEDDNSQTHLDLILGICAAMPRLDDLQIHNPVPFPGLESAETIPIRPFANLRRLHFGIWSSCNVNQIGAFLSATPQLEIVNLCWAPFRDTRNWGRCCASDIWEGLAVRKDTLKEIYLDIWSGTVNYLHLDDRDLEEFEYLEIGVTERYSLADFTRLEVLEAGEMALPGLTNAWKRRHSGDTHGHWAEIFPRGIREVTLPYVIRYLEGLAEAVEAGRYTALRKARVRDRGYHAPHGPNEAISKLETAFMGAGVKFGFLE